MDQKRAKALEALSKYIEEQRALLARTQADIARLRGLRDEIADDTESNFDELNERLKAGSSKLSDLRDAFAPLPKELDWSVFKGHDPTPFRELASTTRHARTLLAQPSTTQSSPPSALQQLVRSSRPALDAFLASYAPLVAPSASDTEDDEPPDPEEERRARERAKIRELKMRRLSPGHAGGLGGLRRPLGGQGVFIRQDQDESADVEVDVAGEGGGEDGGELRAGGGGEDRMEVDTPPTLVQSKVSVGPGKNPALVIPAVSEDKTERRTKKKAHASTSKAKAKVVVEPAVSEIGDEPTPPAERTKGKGKAKSETYKQSWSVEEQHLLERLLEEIPQGEKNRWSKISKAMGGRRTPRQVASRVQKYFEKLKRFGIDGGTS